MRIHSRVAGAGVVLTVIGVDDDHQTVFLMVETQSDRFSVEDPSHGFTAPGGPATTFHITVDMARRLAVLLTDAAQARPGPCPACADHDCAVHPAGGDR